MAKTEVVDVASTLELNRAITHFTTKGYAVTSRTDGSATMKKTGAENLRDHWYLVLPLLLLCLLPGFIYIIYVGVVKGDLMVVINVDPESAAAQGTKGALLAAAGPGSVVDELLWSEDRHYWWDGHVWVSAQSRAPAGVPLSDDGSQWWDGQAWRPAIPGKTNPEEPTSA